MRTIPPARWLPALVALLLVTAARAGASPRTGFQIEGGIGSIYARPLEIEATPGITLAGTIDMPLARSLRGSCELTTTVGRDFASYTRAPGDAAPGSRTLTTLLVGVETIDPRTSSGHFAGLGVGVGYATLSGARGSSASGVSTDIEDRSTTGLAVGAGVGYRFSGGPGAYRFQIALRAHALFDAGEVPATTYMFMLGLAR
ncbi:MAG TPA: hypothetical protein VI792_06405 [Candidatus Eisenbacteria bacterium]